MVCCWAIPGAPKQSWSATVAFTHAKLLVLRWADEVSSTGLYQKVHNGLFIERRKRGMCRHAQGVRCVTTLVPAHPELRRPRTALFGIAWGGPVTGATHTYHSRAHEFSFYIPCATRSSAAQAPFQLLLRVLLVACCDWDGILARHAVALAQASSHARHIAMLLTHLWNIGAVGRDSFGRRWSQNINWWTIA